MTPFTLLLTTIPDSFTPLMQRKWANVECLVKFGEVVCKGHRGWVILG